MQAIFENKDERSNSGGVTLVDIILCIRRISRWMERKHIGRFGIRESRIQISRRIFVGTEESIWKRR